MSTTLSPKYWTPVLFRLSKSLNISQDQKPLDWRPLNIHPLMWSALCHLPRGMPELPLHVPAEPAVSFRKGIFLTTFCWSDTSYWWTGCILPTKETSFSLIIIGPPSETLRLGKCFLPLAEGQHLSPWVGRSSLELLMTGCLYHPLSLTARDS